MSNKKTTFPKMVRIFNQSEFFKEIQNSLVENRTTYKKTYHLSHVESLLILVLGIDRRAKRRVLRKAPETSSEEESSEEESNEEEEAEEEENTETAPSNKPTPPIKPSLSSGDVASTKPIKTSSSTEVHEHPATSKSRPVSRMKTDQSSESSASSGVRKPTPSAKASETKAKQSVTSSTKSLPVQRVYMYKSTNSSEPGTPAQTKPPTQVVTTQVVHTDGEKRSGNNANSSGKTLSSSSASNSGDVSSRKSEGSHHHKHHATTSGSRSARHANVLTVLKSGGNLG